MPCAPLSILGGPGVPPLSIDNSAHGTEKLLLSEDFAQ